jgi:plastocyanin
VEAARGERPARGDEHLALAHLPRYAALRHGSRLPAHGSACYFTGSNLWQEEQKLRAGALSIVFVAVLALAPNASAASTVLTGVRAMGGDTLRYSYRYGPVPAAPGQNLILAGPVTVEKPPGDGYMTRIVPNIVRADGSVPPVEVVHMHHAVFINLSQRDATSPELPGARIYAFGEEKTVGQTPPGYGYPSRGSDVWAINYMLHNEVTQPETIFITYDVDWVPAGSAQAQGIRSVRPVWLDVQNGRAYPVFDVHRGTGTDGRFTYPDQAGGPYGAGPRRNEWTVDRDGTLIGTAGHVHPGGLWTDLWLDRSGRSAHLFRSDANYFDPNGPVSWDMAMGATPQDWRVGVHKGDVMRVTATYDTKRASWYESMGIMLVYMVDGEGGPDPFANPPAQTGPPTHGHLPEASNYGGRASGLPDPTRLPDGATVSGEVGIMNFGYLPGDQSYPLGGNQPPTVSVGKALRFQNGDAPSQIFHTVTACAAPCNASTGISFPLANGPSEFDSGELGYGPEGLTAATQKEAWSTPSDLAPGTYTYFCRVHPFMRGSFRVLGAAGARSAIGAGARGSGGPRILSRSVRVTRSGVARVRVACSGGGLCRGRLSLGLPTVGGRAASRVRTLGSSRFGVGSGHKGVAHVRLSRSELALVRRRGRLPVLAAATGAAPVQLLLLKPR